MISLTEENYLKSIFHLQETGSPVSTNRLAEKMNTRAASVTDMLKKLKNKKFLTYEKYYGCKLTPKGRKFAVSVIRRHRLWEYFLVEKLGFDWHEVHEIAEQLEHVQASGLTEKLEAYLGHPKTDPHGDPIPDQEGNFERMSNAPLSDWPLQKPAVIEAVGEQSHGLHQAMTRKHLKIGTNVKVDFRNAFDGSIDLLVEGQITTTIGHNMATNIYVKEA